MKKIIMYGLLAVAVVLNAYLIFIWTPKDFTVDEESQSTISTYSPVYKLDREEISKRLSEDEKENLKLILEKLSIFDMENVNEFLNKGDEEDVRKAFSLMSRRLSSDDYKKVKEIFSEFINISEIEKL